MDGTFPDDVAEAPTSASAGSLALGGAISLEGRSSLSVEAVEENEAKSFDISDLQVVIEFPADAGGSFWHPRIALHRVLPDEWVMHTPEVSLKVVDLMERSRRNVGHCSFFPRAQAAFASSSTRSPRPRSSGTRGSYRPTRTV
eukprot:8577372-Heterocapsa_arctica.AAC.1